MAAPDIQGLLWGTIPIECQLDPAAMKDGSTSSSNQQPPQDRPGAPPPTCHFMVPRQGYLFLSIDHIKSEFAAFVAQEGSLWLSHEGVPVPWQHPVAAWIDEIAAKQRVPCAECVMPLKLTAHLQKPPENVQVFADSRMARLLVYERLKAALVVRYGCAAAVRELREHRRNDYDALFSAVKNNEPRLFAAARRRLDIAAMALVEAAEDAANAAAAAADGTQRSTPPLQTATAASSPGAAVEHLGMGDRAASSSYPLGAPAIPRPGGSTSAGVDPLIPVMLHRAGTNKVAVRGLAASKRSLGSILKDLMPAEFDCLTSEQCYGDTVLPAHVGVVVVQGISPLLSTPLDALFEMFAAVDGFLHLSVAFGAAPEPAPKTPTTRTA